MRAYLDNVNLEHEEGSDKYTTGAQTFTTDAAPETKITLTAYGMSATQAARLCDDVKALARRTIEGS